MAKVVSKKTVKKSKVKPGVKLKPKAKVKPVLKREIKLLVDIVVVLDRSGSMSTVVHDTVGGFNSFLKSQQTQNPKAKFTLHQFDNEYTTICYDWDIKDVKPLVSFESYQPRGTTALYDAIGKSINQHTTVSGGKKRKTIFVIQTDGIENASREFSKSSIAKMIKDRRAAGWEFIFLGADESAMSQGDQIGIQHTMNYQGNITRGMRVATMCVTRSAMGGDVSSVLSKES